MNAVSFVQRVSPLHDSLDQYNARNNEKRNRENATILTKLHLLHRLDKNNSLLLVILMPLDESAIELVQILRVLQFDFGSASEEILNLLDNSHLRFQPKIQTFQLLVQLEADLCKRKTDTNQRADKDALLHECFLFPSDTEPGSLKWLQQEAPYVFITCRQ